MSAARLILALFAVLPGHAALAQEASPPLGRLFMTPEWRTHLERQRQFNIKETRSLEGGTIRLDGVVVRSSGKSTVWVNDQPQHEQDRSTGVIATPSARQPGSATLATNSEPPTDLKVGATINRATRETEGGLTQGEIRVHRPAPKK